MSTANARRAAARAAIDRAIHEALDAAWGRHRQALFRLLRHVRSASRLLRPDPDLQPDPAAGRNDTKAQREVLGGLAALAAHHDDWLRPVEEWLPAGQSALPVFATLAAHLLAHYPMPAHLTSVWFRGADADAHRYQGWYKHLGLGRSIRTANIPIAYTKAMAHQFVRAPAHLPVEHALRWGQVRGLGGSAALAQAVIATRLGHACAREEELFWKSVIQFLVAHPLREYAHVGPLVEYLHDQKFAAREVFTEDGLLEQQAPPLPGLTLKGRTARSLLRDLAAWQERRELEVRRPGIRWPRCSIGEFRALESDPGPDTQGQCTRTRLWTIRELLNSTALRVEGRAMHHCVADYVGSCTRRETTIWSLKIADRLGQRRILTIQVDPHRRVIRQARRCCNDGPNPKDREILERWAQQEGLTIAEVL